MALKDQLVNDILHDLSEICRSPFTNTSAIEAVKTTLGLSKDSYRARVPSGTTIHGELDPSQTDTTNRYKVLTMAYAVSKTGNSGYDYSGLTKPVSNRILNTKPDLDQVYSVLILGATKLAEYKPVPRGQTRL